MDNPNKIYFSSGKLVHRDISYATDQYEWTMPQSTITLADSAKVYFIYAKCSANSDSASWHVDEAMLRYDILDDYYYFKVGVVYEVVDGVRSVEFDYGQTWINGRFISTGRIQSVLGEAGSYFDLDTGVLKIGEGSLGLDNFSEWSAKQAVLDELANYMNVIVPDALSAIQDQIDGVVISYFEAYSPTTSNSPAGDWTTDIERDNHLNDTFTNTLTGASYRWVKVGTTYSWSEMIDSSTTAALAAAAHAQDTADGKRRVFIVTPFTPYDSGDLWADSASGDLMKCITQRLTGSYNASDWAKATKYTDDTAANLAAAAAASAAASAATANANIADISNDDKITPAEKQALKLQWDSIVSEKTKNDAQASSFGVSSTAYGSAYSTLNSYIGSNLSSLTTTWDLGSGGGATMRANFKAYYDARTDLLNSIASKAKALADTAQSSANTAITNAAAAATAASVAAAAAAAAQTSANGANALLADIANDNKLTPDEKISVSNEWGGIQSEKTKNDTQATTFGVSAVAYGTAYSALSTYITPLLASLTTTSDIVGTTFRSTFKVYYDARVDLLNAISAKAKTLADTAQSTANSATTLANNAQTAATNAQTDATSALGQLTNIVSDNVLSAAEKSGQRQEWNVVSGEKTTLDGEATTFGITTEKTTYDNAFQALATYLNNGTTYVSGVPTWLADANLATNTTIVGSTYRTTWGTLYTARVALRVAVSTKAKTLADAAQTQANTATTNAATAQAAAFYASTSAGAAQTDATSALNKVADIVSDNSLSPNEKADQRKEWNIISTEKAGINTQASTFSITTENTTYNNAFQALATYLNNGTTWSSGVPSWLADGSLATSQLIVGATYRTAWETFYAAKTALLNAISLKAKTIADVAQTTATTASTSASTALSTANSATAAASTAQADATNALGQLTNITSDNVLSGAEKSDQRLIWNTVAAEKAGIDAQATAFSITTEKTTYDNAFQALATYLNNGTTYVSGVPTWLADANISTNTVIVGSTYRTTWETFYAAKVALINTITAKAKSLADTAQSSANTAMTNAAAAATAASTAQTSANGANALLADIANDNKLTPDEKISVSNEWGGIQSEKTKNDTQATTFGVSAVAYRTAYSALSTYITPLLASLTTTSDIVGTTFRSTFKAYYDARVDLLNAISANTKTLADAAQLTASSATTLAADAQATASISTVAAAAAQTQANTAISIATAAQIASDGANALMADMASDAAITPAEKLKLKIEWLNTLSELPKNDAQAIAFGVLSASYDAAFLAVCTYLNGGAAYVFGTLGAIILPLWISDAYMSVTTTVVALDFSTIFKTLYDERTNLINAIALKAKTLADTAQLKADAAKVSADAAQVIASTAVSNAATAQAAASAAKVITDNFTLISGGVVTSNVVQVGSEVGGISAGISGVYTSGLTDIRFWAGSSYANRGTAPFRVRQDGAVFATSGTIGGWTLGSTTLSSSKITLDSSTSGGIMSINNAAGTGSAILLTPTGIDVSWGGVIRINGASGYGGIQIFNNNTYTGTPALQLSAAGNIFNSSMQFQAAGCVLSWTDNNGSQFILPRLTTTQRNALTATQGTLIYNTTTGRINVYQSGGGAGWYTPTVSGA